MSLPVVVREGSTVPLSRAVFLRLNESPAFGELCDQGIISLVRTKEVQFGLKAYSYVGQALLDPETRLVIEEKTKGSLQALLAWSVPEDVREVAVQAPVSEQEAPVFESFARHFLQLLATYLRHGRLKEYVSPIIQSSSPRGRLDFGLSMKLRARGRVGVLAHALTRLSADIVVNRVLGLAIHVIDRYSLLNRRGGHLGELARVYAPLFEDVDWHGLAHGSWDQRAAAVNTALASPRITEDLKAALLYARAIVLHLAPWPAQDWDPGPQTSYFLNLATLFEDAVRRVCQEAVAGNQRARAGTSYDKFLFRDISDLYQANPDVVVSRGSHVLLAADAKYKILESSPHHPDVYQLISHCLAFGASKGVLVYPGDSYALVGRGTTSDGIEISWATVRPAHLRLDIRQLLHTLTPALAIA